MFQKITFIITLLFAASLFYLQNKINAVANFKFANAKDFVTDYVAAADQFWLVGMIVFFTSWIWVNVVALKTAQLFWLSLPLLFITVVAITNSNHDEELFHFKKANGLWKGGFSLTYLFAIGQILIAAFVILINYIVLKRYLPKNPLKVKL